MIGYTAFAPCPTSSIPPTESWKEFNYLSLMVLALKKFKLVQQVN
ncbi:hypothetical protein [Maribacter sp. IgM3_T14_3]